MKRSFLPYTLRWIGYALLVGGVVLGYLWGFAGFKPDWLNIPVFAVYSSYLKTVIFGMSRTNLADELTCILLFTGLLWLMCSKEKEESPETDLLRYKALFLSVLLNTAVLVLGILFIFGIGFIEVLILNLFTQLAFYLVIFRILIFRRG